jgi:hypothetical protein
LFIKEFFNLPWEFEVQVFLVGETEDFIITDPLVSFWRLELNWLHATLEVSVNSVILLIPFPIDPSLPATPVDRVFIPE